MPTNYSTSLFSANLKFANENQYGGALSIAGCSAEKLVKEYGSPIFVLDQDDFFVRTKAWQAALNESFGTGKLYYAAKSFICVEVAKWLKELKVGLDVCSGGELAVALAADFPAKDIEILDRNERQRWDY